MRKKSCFKISEKNAEYVFSNTAMAWVVIIIIVFKVFPMASRILILAVIMGTLERDLFASRWRKSKSKVREFIKRTVYRVHTALWSHCPNKTAAWESGCLIGPSADCSRHTSSKLVRVRLANEVFLGGRRWRSSGCQITYRACRDSACEFDAPPQWKPGQLAENWRDLAWSYRQVLVTRRATISVCLYLSKKTQKHNVAITYSGQVSETKMVLNTAPNTVHKNDKEKQLPQTRWKGTISSGNKITQNWACIQQHT